MLFNHVIISSCLFAQFEVWDQIQLIQFICVLEECFASDLSCLADFKVAIIDAFTQNLHKRYSNILTLISEVALTSSRISRVCLAAR